MHVLQNHRKPEHGRRWCHVCDALTKQLTVVEPTIQAPGQHSSHQQSMTATALCVMIMKGAAPANQTPAVFHTAATAYLSSSGRGHVTSLAVGAAVAVAATKQLHAWPNYVIKRGHHSFLSRVSILTRDIDIGILSVRPSVRNAPVLDENAYRHSFFSPYGSSPIILVLSASYIFTKFRRSHPMRGR